MPWYRSIRGKKVRLAKSRELLGMRFPIEIAAVHDTTAYARGMAVHIFGRGVRDDVRSPFERTAIDRRGERIIDDQGYAMIMGDAGELLHVQYHTPGLEIISPNIAFVFGRNALEISSSLAS